MNHSVAYFKYLNCRDRYTSTSALQQVATGYFERVFTEAKQMGIVYKKLSENELSRIIKMRIDQLTEEYTSEGKTVPQDVNLEAALMDFYKRNLAAGTYVSWLAFDGDRIVGTSGMSFAEKPPYFTCPSGRIGILSSMYTDPNYRRMGIATQLLDRVVKEAKDRGCGTIYITASDMGVKLYESYGFKHNGNFMQYNF